MIIEKIREYMLQKISELRKPRTNVQMLQNTGLLKYHSLMQFLMEKAPEVAREIRVTYIDSMGRTLHSIFKAYFSQLTKLELEIANKHDLVVVEENSTKAGVFTSKVNLSKRSDTFTLGERDRILENVELEPILVHVAHAEDERYPYEAIFRSIMKHLMDSATNEYLFAIDFFKARFAFSFCL